MTPRLSLTIFFTSVLHAPVNVTGGPAVAIPLHWTAEGLPIGVQFAADFGNEALLFRLAAQLEQAKLWRERRPSLSTKWPGQTMTRPNGLVIFRS